MSIQLILSYIYTRLHQLKDFIKLISLETIIWIAAILFLAIINIPGESHFSICPLHNLGIDFCPGCNLGTSISYLFRGEISNSINSHPLGILTLSVIIIRIYSLLKNNWRIYGKHITTNALS